MDGEHTACFTGDDGAVPHGDGELVYRGCLVVQRPGHRDLSGVPVNSEEILGLWRLGGRDEELHLSVRTCKTIQNSYTV